MLLRLEMMVAASAVRVRMKAARMSLDCSGYALPLPETLLRVEIIERKHDPLCLIGPRAWHKNPVQCPAEALRVQGKMCPGAAAPQKERSIGWSPSEESVLDLWRKGDLPVHFGQRIALRALNDHVDERGWML